MDLYQKLYSGIQFERAGLFALLQTEFNGSEALYPGCNVHLTPSFYFPHVVYVDRALEAYSFFSDIEAISKFIERNKHYRRSAYFRFIHQDYTVPLPLPSATFDLLISLYAGGIARSCKIYLKPGGLLISNDHHQEVHDASMDADFVFLCGIQYQRGKYRLLYGDLPSFLTSRKTVKGHPHHFRQGNRGLEYNENDYYFVFKKTTVSVV